MTLAPAAFVGDNVFRFGKIRRSRVQRGVQVVNIDQHSVRRYVVSVAAVIIRRGTVETSAEWIDPRARTDTGLTAVKPAPYASEQPEPSWVPATPLHPKPQLFDEVPRTRAYPRTGQVARNAHCCSAAAHPVNILRNKRMVAVRKANQSTSIVPWLHASVPKARPTRPPTEPVSDCTKSSRLPTMTSGPGTVPTPGWFSAGTKRILHCRLCRAGYLDRFHGCAERDFAGD